MKGNIPNSELVFLCADRPEIVVFPKAVNVVTDKEIQQTIIKAIPLPDCPVKKAHAIATRVWLEAKILEYISRANEHTPASNDKH